MQVRGGVAILAVAVAVACRPPAPAPPATGGTWALVHPPEIADGTMPMGVRLLPSEPIERWQPTGRFDGEAACDAARRQRINETIDSARRRLGPTEAKFDLDVRRAVNACCVPAGARGEPLLTCRRDGQPLTPP